MNKKSVRQLVIVLLVGLYALMGSACSRQDGADAVNKAIFSSSQVEQAVNGAFCGSDNVLSQC